MKGIKIALQYGYVPHSLGLCGPQDGISKQTVVDFFQNEKSDNNKNISSILKDFKGAYPYYRLIAAANNIADPFDESVVEAYWLGNHLLHNVSLDDYKEMIKKEFIPLGNVKPSALDNLPADSLPFHTFHVLYIGSVSGKIRFTPKAINLCIVNWGTVKEVTDTKLTISGSKINFEKNLKLTKQADYPVEYDKNILPDVKKNDIVSIHWNHAIARLSPRQLENIKKYTRQTLAIFK